MIHPHADHRLIIGTFGRRNQSWGHHTALTWRDLLIRLAQHRRHAIREEKDGPGFVPALLSRAEVPPPPAEGKDTLIYARRAACNIHRCNRDVINNSMLCLDLDHVAGTADLAATWDRLTPFEYYAHTTHSHTPEAPRWRVILPLSIPVQNGEWRGFWYGAVHRFTGTYGTADPHVKDPSRFYYWPARQPGGEALHRLHPGALLSIGDVRYAYPDADWWNELHGRSSTRDDNTAAGSSGKEKTGAADPSINGPPIPQGARDATLFAIACALRAAGWEREAIHAQLLAVNAHRCTPPIGPEDAKGWADLQGKARAVCKRYPAGWEDTVIDLGIRDDDNEPGDEESDEESEESEESDNGR